MVCKKCSKMKTFIPPPWISLWATAPQNYPHRTQHFLDAVVKREILITTKLPLGTVFSVLGPPKRTSYHVNSQVLFLVPKVESMIVAPLGMVSPMFICSPSRLESSASCGSWQHLCSVCMFIGSGSSLVGFLGDQLKCVLLIQTRQRSSAWALLVGKHQQNQKVLFIVL